MSPTPSTAMRTAEFLRFASDPSRAAVILTLKDGDRSGGDLIEATGLEPSALSPHLSMLRAGGLITSERRPRESRHQLTPKGRTLLAAIEALGANA